MPFAPEERRSTPPSGASAPIAPAEQPRPEGSVKDAIDGCVQTAVDFDFSTKACSPVAVEDALKAIAAGRFVWIDIDYSKVESARRALTSLGLLADPVIEDVFIGEPGTSLARYVDYIHVTIAGCRINDKGQLSLERVDVLMGERFLISVHEGSRVFLEMVKRDYHSDFTRFAKSPSFLLYEIWDNLTEHYISIQKTLEKRVHRLQHELFRHTDDQVFAEVSAIGENLLHFRSVLVPVRTVLTELATRRTVCISEATQGFLSNMVGTVERVLQDVLVDRDIIAQSLSLHMSMMSHKTSRTMNKLTVISTIFLPLTFLCGVYGMNFQEFPELTWRYGYLFFWGLAGVIAGGLLLLMKKNKLL